MFKNSHFRKPPLLFLLLDSSCRQHDWNMYIVCTRSTTKREIYRKAKRPAPILWRHFHLGYRQSQPSFVTEVQANCMLCPDKVLVDSGTAPDDATKKDTTTKKRGEERREEERRISSSFIIVLFNYYLFYYYKILYLFYYHFITEQQIIIISIILLYY